MPVIDRTVSFDLDGTLVRGPMVSVMRGVLSRFGGDELWHRTVARHRERLAAGSPTAYDWAAIIVEVLAGTGVRCPAEAIHDELAAGARTAPVQVIDPDTAARLTGLRERGWRIVVLTNGYRDFQSAVLRSAGLDRAVDVLVCSDDVGAVKPSPQAFSAARRGAGTHVHVGDRLDHDVVGAHGAGASAILLRPDVPACGHTTAGAWSGLAGYLEALAASEGWDAARAEPAVVMPEVLAPDLETVTRVLSTWPG